MNTITLSRQNKILNGEVLLPSSKSISNRALILQYLSGNRFTLNNLSEADDTQLLVQLLKLIKENKGSKTPVRIDCGNAGTTLRFLTALLAITPGNWVITGSERMKERPISILTESLKKFGTDIRYTDNEGFPPMLIEGKNLTGGFLEIDGSISSQFISALLLIAPAIRNGIALKIKNKVSSLPYIEMTLKLLRQFGIDSTFDGHTIQIEKQDFYPGEISIEPDWTSASYWYEMVAFSDDANLILKNLSNESIQGDAILPEIYKSFGVKTEYLTEGIKLTRTRNVVKEFSFDFANHPDLAQSVIVTCAGLNIPGIFTGLESLRIKETDRIIALCNELEKIGYKIRLQENSVIRLVHSTQLSGNRQPATGIRQQITTYGDHRMSMAFAPLTMVIGPVQIEEPDVVSKSYPGFWDDLKQVGFEVTG